MQACINVQSVYNTTFIKNMVIKQPIAAAEWSVQVVKEPVVLSPTFSGRSSPLPLIANSGGWLPAGLESKFCPWEARGRHCMLSGISGRDVCRRFQVQPLASPWGSLLKSWGAPASQCRQQWARGTKDSRQDSFRSWSLQKKKKYK